MSLNDTIAQLMLEVGRARAAGVAGAGAAWGRALQSTGQDVGQAIQSIPQIQDQQRARDARKAMADAMQNTPSNPDGTMDIPSIEKAMSAKGFGPEFAPAADHLDKVNAAILNVNQSRLNLVKTGAAAVAAGGNDPTLAHHFIDTTLKGIYPDEDRKKFSDFIDADPGNTAKLTSYLAGPQKPIILPATPRGGGPAQALNPLTNQPVATGTPAQPQAPTEAELAVRAAQGDPTATGAMDILKPKPRDTANQDAERYINILTDKKLGKPISPQDQAWSESYVSNKTIGPEASAAAASLRQANTIAEQNALQKNAQQFSVAQAGRKELTDKVEQPYLDSAEKTATLRRTVALAQSGNKEAANLTPLLATLGVVTSEGVKRINRTEVDQVAGAGNLLDKIEGKVGKLVKGQPLPKDLQDDIVQLSNMLEEGARSKYEQGWNATTKRYGLNDETMLPKPQSVTPAANQPIVGERRMINGQMGEWDGKGWKPVIPR